jgi:hypothetical protein
MMSLMKEEDEEQGKVQELFNVLRHAAQVRD